MSHPCTHTLDAYHTRMHTRVVVSDNRMVSRCYRGKKRCTEFTRYPMVVKMLKQQLSAPRSFLSSDAGMYVCMYRAVYIIECVCGIWIILSCDCPCGGSIKIWAELFERPLGTAKNGELLFNYPFFVKSRTIHDLIHRIRYLQFHWR